MELTRNETDVLNQLYSNPVELERIKNGNLYDYQIVALEKLRGFIDYLENKYHLSGFQILRYEQATLSTMKDFYSFSYLDDSTHYHGIIENNGKYTDDFYSYNLEPLFNQQIKELINEYPVAGIKTFFKTLYNEPFEISTDLLYIKKPIRNIEIFVNREQDISLEIINLLKENQIKGNFRIYFSTLFEEELEIDDYWKLWKEKNEIIKAVAFRLD